MQDCSVLWRRPGTVVHSPTGLRRAIGHGSGGREKYIHGVRLVNVVTLEERKGKEVGPLGRRRRDVGVLNKRSVDNRERENQQVPGSFWNFPGLGIFLTSERGLY